MARTPNNPLSDPALESLLDQALAPQAAPRGLEDRILSRTMPLVAARHEPVIGRIGFAASPAFRAAAAVAIAATLGLLTYLGQRSETPTPPAHTTHLARIDTRLEAINRQVAGAVEETTAIRYQIDMLDLQVALVESRPMWSETSTPIDDPMLDAEMGLYDLDPELIF